MKLTDDRYFELSNLIDVLLYQYNIEFPVLKRVIQDKCLFLSARLSPNFSDFIGSDISHIYSLSDMKKNLDILYKDQDNYREGCICEENYGLANEKCFPCKIVAIEEVIHERKEASDNLKEYLYDYLKDLDLELLDNKIVKKITYVKEKVDAGDKGPGEKT